MTIENGDAPVSRLSSTTRVEAFSDGVMAIAITLLVLDLKVPSTEQVGDAGGLIPALLVRWPSYLAYLAAFLTIGIIWLNHRAFVDKVRTFDNRMQSLNLLLLLGVATLPSPRPSWPSTSPRADRRRAPRPSSTASCHS